MNVTDEAGWNKVVADTVALYGRLDVLVNNAGISGSAVNDLLDTGIWHRVMEVNATGVFLGTYGRAAMQKDGGGSIVNLSSISGVVGQTMVHMAYNASKGAVRTMTKSTAVQFGNDKIRANSVHPGLMPPMRTSGATADPAVRAKMLQACLCAAPARWMRWRTPSCSLPRTRLPTSPAPNSMSMAAIWPHRRLTLLPKS